MTVINRYIENQSAYIAKKKEQPLIGFTNAKGQPATWNDIAITFKDSDHKTQNIFFCNKNKKTPKIGTNFTDDDRLAHEAHDLLFSYMLDVMKENVTINNKKSKISSARQFLCHLEENIAVAPLEKIQRTIDSMTYTNMLLPFFTWLHRNKMLPTSSMPKISNPNKAARHKSGDDALEAEQSKLPSEKALLALGAIFYDVIPPYVDDKKENIDCWQPLLSPIQSQQDSFICTMVALGMASPNRVAAEQVLLTTQRIKRHTESVDEEDKTVHYLNWRGSKGYEDYQNHINAEMVESLDRALHYTILATEPARALARFYRKPDLPLKKVLGEFKPSDENIELLKPQMNQPTNLLHLGLLLGFFDDGDKCVRVAQNTSGAIEVKTSNQYPKYIKPIAQIEASDTLVFKSNCLYSKMLTGCPLSSKGQYKKYLAGKQELTLTEFQNHYIEINKSQLNGYNRHQTKSVDFDKALFAYTHKQLSGRVSNPFLLVPIKTLSNFFSNDLSKYEKTRLTIFERHGFSSSFILLAHQLRHWQDDYLAKKGLPHILITMLSGRKSPEQTLSYIHITDAQNASVIGDISCSSELESDVETKISLRIKTKEEFDEAVNNQVPTFVHETGFCTQNLALSPCTYMSDFETQCALCSSSCHAAHDCKAIELLQKDLLAQTRKLTKVQKDSRFILSEGMHNWFETHYSNTCMLKNLIEVLSDKAIKRGSIVRLLANSNCIRITDLETKTVTERKLALPNAKKALQAAIDAKKDTSTNEASNNFLSFIDSF